MRHAADRVLGTDISLASPKLILRKNSQRLLLPSLLRKGIKA
jgi:hypothetical protein